MVTELFGYTVDNLFYLLRVVSYPMMATASFLSFAMRLYFVWYIHRVEDRSPFFWWTLLEARKLTNLAITNLWMTLAFGAIAVTINDRPTITTTGKVVAVLWSCCWPFYLYSVRLKYKELIERSQRKANRDVCI